MLSASSQHTIAIVLIVVFGFQAFIALLYLLYKTVGIPIIRPTGGIGTGVAQESPVEIEVKKDTGVSEAVAKIETLVKELEESDAALGEKVDSGFGSMQNQLTKAGREANIWNLANVIFGATGVIIGIIAL
jgi:hypothetical protein